MSAFLLSACGENTPSTNVQEPVPVASAPVEVKTPPPLVQTQPTPTPAPQPVPQPTPQPEPTSAEAFIQNLVPNAPPFTVSAAKLNEIDARYKKLQDKYAEMKAKKDNGAFSEAEDLAWGQFSADFNRAGNALTYTFPTDTTEGHVLDILNSKIFFMWTSMDAVLLDKPIPTEISELDKEYRDTLQALKTIAK